jgi:SAM-dependent methyltransferase
MGHAPPAWATWLRRAGMTRANSICDVGCGRGDQLVRLKYQGFKRLTGADAYIPETITRDGITIHKATPAELNGSYDFVILNHSFEHMPDPPGTLATLGKLVNPGGCLMIRIPVAGSEAWQRYGVDWVQLDPPRHLFVPSEAGFRSLAAKCGLKVVDLFYDSTNFQFWGSEQIQRDIPLFDPRSYSVDPAASPFTPNQIRTWDRRAAEVNDAGTGDAAAFFLRHR